MKLITKDTDYAIRALCYITKSKKKIISVSEFARNLKISHSFLRKILQVLNKKHLLKSYKGKGGGFVLSKEASKIFVIDIIKIFQGPVSLHRHIFKKSTCPNIKICILKNKLDKMQQQMISELKSITIKGLSK